MALQDLQIYIVNRYSNRVDAKFTLSPEEVKVGYKDFLLKSYKDTNWYAVLVAEEGE